MTTAQTQENSTPKRIWTGKVISAKTEKTLVVAVERDIRHALYGKSFTRTRKFHVHDPRNQYKEGETVEFVECRPISKTKKWKVVYPTKANA